MNLVTTALEVVGMACLAVAGFLVAPALGMAAIGVACVVVGYTLGRES